MSEPMATLTEEDINFLMWALGFAHGHLLKEQAPNGLLKLNTREEVAQRCLDIALKLQAIPGGVFGTGDAE